MRFTLLFLAAVSLWGVAGLRAADLSSTARIDTLDQQIRITGNRFVETVHSRKTILMAAGRDFGRLVVSETPFQKITSLELLVQDASGRTITKIHKKDMTKFCGFGASYELYNDNCTFVYHPQVASYPYSIVVNYEIECSSLFFLTGVEIPRDIPVSFAQVVLDCESDRPVRYKAYHLDVSPVVTRSQNREISTWVIQNLEAEKEWLSLPPEWVGGSSIRMAASQFGLENFGCQPVTWRNLGRFYAALSESRYLSPTGTSSPREHDAAVAVCDSLYRSVVDGTRYVAVSIGLSGWQPQAAEKTEQVGYGDCKAVSTLLVSRIRQAGLTAYPCLVLTSDEGAVDTAFASDNFNHVITMAIVDHDTLWYDATSQTCPPGELPSVDEGIFVLAVTDTGGVMVKTPSASAERNVVHRNSQVAIDDSCRVTISAEAELSGHFAQSSRNYVRGEKHEDVMSYIKDYFAGGNSQYVVDSCGTKYEDSLAAPFVLTARMRTTRPIDRLNGGIYYFPFSLTARAPYEGLDLTNRTVPVNLRYPYVVVDSTTIRTHWNSLADSVRLPASDSVAYPDGFVKVNFTRDSLGISGVLTQYFGAKILKVDDFPRFSAFLAARKKLLDRPIKWYVSSTR